MVDLGHEAMIAHWPTLRHWIDESRASEMAGRRIERDADDWRRNGRDPGELYRRHKLADALEFARKHKYELSHNAMRFLAAGRRRRLLERLGLVVVAAAALAGVAWLAVAPIQEAWLKHQAAALSPAVRLASGSAIVGPDHRRVTFPPLSVDVHEVSNQQYRYCVEARRCPQPEEPTNHANFAHGDRSHPVVYVTAYAAAAFCSWLGRRLPTAAEWEWIAGGSHGTRFPWGNARPKPGQVNASINGHQARGGLVPVDDPAFSGGESPQGIEQLIGNAQEWTATRVSGGRIIKWLGNWNGRDPTLDLAVMGGGFEDEVFMGITSAGDVMTTGTANIPDEQTGFRCVATAQ
jgi:hypothetical protein